MAELLTKELNNPIPDVARLFDTLRHQYDGLLSIASLGAPVKNIEAGWIDDVLERSVISVTNCSGTSCSGAVGTSGVIAVGSIVRNEKNANEFQVASVTGNNFTVTALDGTSTPVSGTFFVNNIPIVAEASTRGNITKHQGSKITNYTQIFRADVELSESVLNTETYDRANYVETQVNAALFDVRNAVDDAVWFGVKSKSDADNKRSLAGLYKQFATAGGSATAGVSGQLTYEKLCALATDIEKRGGRPDVLIANPALAGALAKILWDKFHVQLNVNLGGPNASNTIGAESQYFKSPIGKQMLEIHFDGNCPVGDIWMGNKGAIEIKPLGDRFGKVTNASTPDKDAIAMKIITECTLFIHNIYNHFGYITGITA